MVGATGQKDINFFIRILATKWTAQVVVALAGGRRRLSQLRSHIPGASKKMLVDSLHRLTDQGFVTRVDLTKKLQHVEYSLTNDGQKLLILVRHLEEIDKRLNAEHS